MTVKSFPSFIKDQVVKAYTQEKKTISWLAQFWNTSPRTIGRILEEYEIASPMARAKGEAYIALQACKKHGVDPHQLEQLLDMNLVDLINNGLKEGLLSPQQAAEAKFLLEDQILAEMFDPTQMYRDIQALNAQQPMDVITQSNDRFTLVFNPINAQA